MKNYITISDYDTDLSRDWLEVCTIEEDQSVRWECDCNEPYITDRIEFKVDCADFAFDSTGLTITSSDLVIDWGDGTTDERFTATVPSHTYAKKDIYKVKVKPYNSSQANWFVFLLGSYHGTAPTYPKVIEVHPKQTLTDNMLSTDSSACGLFKGCNNLKKIPVNLFRGLTLNTKFNAMFMDSGVEVIPPELFYPLYTGAALPNGIFSHMFSGCTNIEDIPINLFKPFEESNLGTRCFMYMFTNCTSLVNVPITLLPWTSIPGNAYLGMFEGCTSLVDLPNLHCNTFTQQSCMNMFANTGVTTIPADFIKGSAGFYALSDMFKGCKNLEKILDEALDHISYITDCAVGMFAGCDALTDLGNIDLNWMTSRSTQTEMFKDCTAIATPITYTQIPTTWK